MKINVWEAAGFSLLGMALVFLVLLVIMGVIFLIGKTAKDKQPAAAAPGFIPPAPATAGRDEVKLFDVDDRTAALLMAIVAHKTEIPIENLHFISIREAGDQER